MSEKELNNATDEITVSDAEAAVDSDNKVDKKVDKKDKKDTDKKEFFLKRFGKKIARTWKNYIGEMKKITWPTAKQTVKNTIVVIVVMIVVALFVAALDVVFQKFVELLSKIG